MRSPKPSKIGIGVAIGAVLVVAGILIFDNSPSKSRVPDLVGIVQPAAVNDLSAAQLKVKIINLSSGQPPTHLVGTVLSQTPAAGTSVASGSVVSLYVYGTGATVPNVIGQTVSDAHRELSDAGFVVHVRLGPAIGTTPYVVSQTLKAGTFVAKGSVIEIDGSYV